MPGLLDYLYPKGWSGGLLGYGNAAADQAQVDQERAGLLSAGQPGAAILHRPMDNPAGFAFGVGTVGGKLPMDTASRMARAEAMGFTTDAYKAYYPYTGGAVKDFHGNIVSTSPEREITEMAVNRKSGGPFSDWVMNGREYAGFYTDNPHYANEFAAGMGESAVLPAKLKMQNPAVIDMGGKPARAAQFSSLADSDPVLIKRVRDAMDNPSVDGVVLRNTGDEGTVFIPKASKQVRSRFAAFDPSKKDSSDLMAGIAGMLGLTGLLGAQEDQTQ